ncbi:MAG: NUDIX hydrolase [Gammaproteobacteria bacterium]
MPLTRERIAECLAARAAESEVNPYPASILTGEQRPAAVLIAFTDIGGEWHVLFIRRAENVNDRHSGQVAFPGGAFEPGDSDLVRTALREAHEEIGLPPADVAVLGRMQQFASVTNYSVTPVVGTISWPREFRLQHEEVSRVFTIPYRWLADAGNHEIRERVVAVNEPPIPIVYFRDYDGEMLWGASARMMLNLIQALGSEG